ncbi:Hypothetical predicted protein, partial [Pelobates cultripes]
IHVDVQKFIRNMSLKRFFIRKKSENPRNFENTQAHEQNPLKRFKPPSTFCPYDKGSQLEVFNQMVLRDLDRFTKKREFCNNLTKKEMGILNQLKDRDDIIIKNADKGGAIVVMSVEFYLEEAYGILGDKNTYTKLHGNPNQDFKGALEIMLKSALKDDIIDLQVYTFLYHESPRIPKNAFSIQRILKKHWSILQQDEYLGPELPDRPQAIYRKGRNFASYLTSSLFTQKRGRSYTRKGFYTCGHCK